MKTICLFGATGRTGKMFLQKALNKGYKVRALVRDNSKIFEHEYLMVILGDILNYNDVEKAVEGSDIVVVLIGHTGSSPANIHTIAIKYIIDAMKKHEVNRLIVLTGGGVRDLEHDVPRIPDKVIVFAMKKLSGPATRNALSDSIHHVEYIKNSGLDWTIIRVPVIKDKPPKGKYEVGYVGTVKGLRLTREDLTDFILKEIEQNKHILDMPFVTNG